MNKIKGLLLLSLGLLMLVGCSDPELREKIASDKDYEAVYSKLAVNGDIESEMNVLNVEKLNDGENEFIKFKLTNTRVVIYKNVDGVWKEDSFRFNEKLYNYEGRKSTK